MKELIEKLNFRGVELDNKKLTLMVIILIFILYVDFAYILKLQVKGLKKSGPGIASLRSDLDTLTKDLEKMQDLKAKKITRDPSLALKTKRLVSEAQVSNLLQSISDRANKNDIKIAQIKPVKEVVAKPADKHQAQPEKFIPLSIAMELSGEYHSFGKFLNDLEDMDVFVAVESMKIGVSAQDYLKQKVNLVLRTYVKK